jgi:hypothetical protein
MAYNPLGGGEARSIGLAIVRLEPGKAESSTYSAVTKK